MRAASSFLVVSSSTLHRLVPSVTDPQSTVYLHREMLNSLREGANLPWLTFQLECVYYIFVNRDQWRSGKIWISVGLPAKLNGAFADFLSISILRRRYNAVNLQNLQRKYRFLCRKSKFQILARDTTLRYSWVHLANCRQVLEQQPGLDHYHFLPHLLHFTFHFH